MQDHAIVIQHPSQMTERDRTTCIALIVEGDAVDHAYVEEWFPRSIVVAVRRLDAEIVGVGVIKPSRRGYAKQVAARSGYGLDPEMHELGYITVREDHRRRGIARAVVQTLDTEHEAPLFATTGRSRLRIFLVNSVSSNEATSGRVIEAMICHCGSGNDRQCDMRSAQPHQSSDVSFLHYKELRLKEDGRVVRYALK